MLRNTSKRLLFSSLVMSSLTLMTLTALTPTFCARAAPLARPPAAKKAMALALPRPQVPRDGKFEASFTLPGQTGNPFDPRDNDVEVTFTGPSGLKVTQPAFWDGDRWRVRYAPPKVGGYALSVSRSGAAFAPPDLSPRRFQCVASQDSGFVRRDPKVIQRFLLGNGQPFYPLGMDFAWQNGSDPGYPQVFTQMAAAHMNWVRIWMNNWDGKNLEWAASRTGSPPIGRYDLDAARRWDMIFDQAAKSGIYVQMTLQHHGEYTAHTDPNWADNPFNTANGGFLKNPDDFFTDPEARRLTRAKFRYIVARYGYSTHLMAYELFNEVQNITEVRGHFQDVVNWHKEMAAYIRSLDVNHHLITTSNSVPGEPLAQIGLDYDQIHTYPPDILSTFASVKTAGVPVPVFYGEWGTGGRTTLQDLHDGLWASLASPTAGAGQFWDWTQIIRGSLWPQFASAAGFIQTFGVANLGGMTRLEPMVSSDGQRGALSFAPPGDWGKTTVFDVTLATDGRAPDLSGITPYIQGTNNRAMMPQPITFHLNAPEACRFEVQVGRTATGGAHAVLALDGTTGAEADFPAATQESRVNQTLGIDVPAGAHTVSVFNTGQDWYLIRRITVTHYVPGVGALARGDARHAVFWAYARDRNSSAPLDAVVTLPGLTPGRYTVRLWAPSSGKALGTVSALSTGHSIQVPIKGLQGDAAGVVTPGRP
jgi:hypothetical protein